MKPGPKSIGRPRKNYTGKNPLMNALFAHLIATNQSYRDIAKRAGYTEYTLTNAVYRQGWMRMQTFTDICEAAGLEIQLVPKEK